MYICTMEGVYRHDILGLFSTIEKAIERGIYFVEKEEQDGYHEIHVSNIEEDESIKKGEDVYKVAIVKRVGFKSKWVTGVGREILEAGQVVVERCDYLEANQ
jgi:hypothetical protein